MTWTYDPHQLSDPNTGPLMQVRFRIGDTLERKQHISDEEIEFCLSSNGGSIGAAAAAAAQHIAVQYSHQASYSSGSWREELNTRAQTFKLMADALRTSSGRKFKPTTIEAFTREQDKASGRL